MKKPTIIWSLVLATMLGLFSCNDSSSPVISINDDFVYPLSIGNSWSYDATMSYSNISPDSIKDNFSDFTAKLIVSVTKKQLIDTLNVFEIKEEGDEFAEAFAYYSNEDNGFLKHAYSYTPDIILPKTNSMKRFNFKEIYFNNIPEFIKKLKKTSILSKIFNDSIVYYEQPRVIFSYPLEVGNEWEFSTSYLKIFKEIIGKETINTGFGNYSCYKIQWKYDLDSDGIVDDDFIYYEYLSSKGIIKRTLTIKKVAIMTIENPLGVGFADIEYKQILTNTNF